VSEDDQKRSFRWTSVAAIAGLIAGPIVLYVLLPRAGVPAALASGVVVAVAFKHLGLLAVVLAPVHAIIRRRSHR
jgi:hypothetical protein